MQEAIGSNPIFSTAPFFGATIFDILDTRLQAERTKGAAAASWRPPAWSPAPMVAGRAEVKKGAWWMPWLKEAMKDVGSCENLR